LRILLPQDLETLVAVSLHLYPQGAVRVLLPQDLETLNGDLAEMADAYSPWDVKQFMFVTWMT
jgi:hypothetical protein